MSTDDAQAPFRAAGISDVRSPTRSDIPTRPMEIVIYSMNKTGYVMKCENGRNTTVAEVHQRMMKTLQLPNIYGPVFALWMTSPLLQVQLKSDQRPSRIRKQWKAMLAKFTTAAILEMETDEPVLSFQRNVFLPIDVEEKIADREVVKLLYEEAVQNVVKYRYPTAKAKCISLAAIQAKIEHKAVTLEIVKESVERLLPVHYRYANRWMSRIKEDEKLAAQVVGECRGTEEVRDDVTCMKKYLAECREFPFYGSIFFYGQIQHERTRFVGQRKDRRVRVAINYTHLHVIDVLTNEIIVGVSLDEMRWDFHPAKSIGDHVFSSFFIEFDCEFNFSHQKVCHQMQIFTRQAAMMDAMVDRCANGLGRREFDDMVERMEQATAEQSDCRSELGCFKRGASIHSQHLVNKVKVDRINEDGSLISPKRSSRRQQPAAS
ncbi:putative FERM domain-containing protein FRMD8P1 [Corticium candelabrum]|uniref:putative FERM domain-containing protein FRMD8P1 n=1 Tax=Corticium candelabrum TaxID=121492 RepID=UPI002E2712BF|nr:putative FERM domain-containing protein FRMD8P1 [Corticium candelabrum]